MNAPSPVIFLAAGGTGGHMFPALALGRKLMEQGITPKLVTDERFAGFHHIMAEFTAAGIEILTIPSASFSGGPVRKLLAATRILSGIRAARALAQEHEAQAVIGFGGYPSFPTSVAARWLKIPLAIHEQNAVLGRANRKLARIADIIATSFPTVEKLPPASRSKCIETGNPVRPDILKLAEQPYPALTAEGKFHLLIIGGSLGASVFSDVLPKAVAELPESLRHRLVITQQVRGPELDPVRAAYQAFDLRPELQPFLSDMPGHYAAAQLVIARAGASTLAELLAARRPALLVPYPHAMDDHQTANARHFTETGGGWMLPQAEFTPTDLAVRLIALMSEPEQLNARAEALRQRPAEDAAAKLAAVVLSMIGSAPSLKKNV